MSAANFAGWGELSPPAPPDALARAGLPTRGRQKLSHYFSVSFSNSAR
jgi:hypothetical protein